MRDDEPPESFYGVVSEGNDEPEAEPDRCMATTKDGRPCPNRPIPNGEGLCFAHDPVLELKRASRASRTFGGRPPKLSKLEDAPEHITTPAAILQALDSLYGQLREKPVSESTIRSLLKVYEAALRAQEAVDFDARLTEIERHAGLGRYAD